ncbi:MAG: 50S ribosomal protein L11 methyltransferase [candidate division KSB1 bacterium]|nr:50S ribosomal protein L11 methyltransferase [candidate division KSB1 bacterium]MDZ7276118.1 50S ribosomal protein L11 methyltransferase [candidate division KSB1 bacterium]MDZ7287102.1 50S ribosomal protein L11 methyltransferase [candidate division KSB1 bacterium]MDZ7296973.1 50S ribosomal protein L11 methyltransferase [candidate division KSB1 bacterium]MDZ7306198.1 50S ribosomal protein L11 methyltransferase [candidate division KSB1 bacterium]
MYSLFDYGDMIADRVRFEAYSKALRQTMKPGAVVLDIGTGTGIFALLACKLGARRVYALETNNAIAVAAELAVVNGCQERITFLQQLSTKTVLPEAADVIISDLRGVLPLLEQHLPSLVDARQRLLAPGGTLLPWRDTLWAAVITAPELYQRHFQPWQQDLLGLDTQPCQRLLANLWQRAQFQPGQLLTAPQCWATLNYHTLTSPHVSGELSWRVTQSGTAHGLCLWFDAELSPGIGFSNAPGQPKTIYGQAFFPWPQPVALAAGDHLTVRLQANLVKDDYVWQWHTRINSGNERGSRMTEFRQSSLWGEPLSPHQLRKRAHTFVPRLNQEGRIMQFILNRMEGRATLADLAHELVQTFPRDFPDWQSALVRLGDLAIGWSES